MTSLYLLGKHFLTLNFTKSHPDSWPVVEIQQIIETVATHAVGELSTLTRNSGWLFPLLKYWVLLRKLCATQLYNVGFFPRSLETHVFKIVSQWTWDSFHLYILRSATCNHLFHKVKVKGGYVAMESDVGNEVIIPLKKVVSGDRH